VIFDVGQLTSVIELQLTSQDGAPTSRVVYYIHLTDVLLSDVDVLGCPASIGMDLTVNYISYLSAAFVLSPNC